MINDQKETAAIVLKNTAETLNRLLVDAAEGRPRYIAAPLWETMVKDLCGRIENVQKRLDENKNV